MPRLATATRNSYHYRDQIDRISNFYIDGVRAVPSDGIGAPPYGDEGDPPRDYLLFGPNNPGMEISALRETPYQVELWFKPDPVCFSTAEHRHLVWSCGAISSTAQTNHRAVVLVVGQNSGGVTIAQAGRRDGTAGGNWSSTNFNVAITPGGWHYFKAIFTSTTAVRFWLYDYTAATWVLNDSGTTYNAGTHEGFNIGNVVGSWGNEMLFSNGDSKPFVGGISCVRVANTSDDGVNPATSGIPTYTPANVGTNALFGFIGPS